MNGEDITLISFFGILFLTMPLSSMPPPLLLEFTMAAGGWHERK